MEKTKFTSIVSLLASLSTFNAFADCPNLNAKFECQLINLTLDKPVSPHFWMELQESEAGVYPMPMRQGSAKLVLEETIEGSGEPGCLATMYPGPKTHPAQPFPVKVGGNAEAGFSFQGLNPQDQRMEMVCIHESIANARFEMERLIAEGKACPIDGSRGASGCGSGGPLTACKAMMGMVVNQQFPPFIPMIRTFTRGTIFDLPFQIRGACLKSGPAGQFLRATGG